MRERDTERIKHIVEGIAGLSFINLKKSLSPHDYLFLAVLFTMCFKNTQIKKDQKMRKVMDILTVGFALLTWTAAVYVLLLLIIGG